jgi:hypothetical protein
MEQTVGAVNLEQGGGREMKTETKADIEVRWSRKEASWRRGPLN